MLSNNLIETESTLGYIMLDEAASNPKIKQVLREISSVLIANILTPISQKLSESKQFSDLPKDYQAMLTHLAFEHSAENRQYGAAMPEMPSTQAILSSMSNMQRLCEVLVNRLLSIDQVDTVPGMVNVMKTILELCTIYYDASPAWHHTQFDALKNLIAPSQEEAGIRVRRTELNEPPKLALTFGIGRTENDLGLKSDGIGYNTGKSTFAVVSMKKRLKLLCKEYDITKSASSAEKLAYYEIPLNISERKALTVYARRWQTCFEKLVTGPNTIPPLPLIAGVSGSTNRILVTLHDLSALTQPDGSFDFDKAQIIANCVMGFLVHAGHHSFSEVAEVYNRLLDYVALAQLETTGPTPAMVEANMPYYHRGNYFSFFNNSYTENIEKNMPVLSDSVVNCSLSKPAP